MDRITAIQVFLNVAETHSFTAAAERMELSRPMVTRAVALVEEWFNARLLHRTTRHVSLTDAGRQAVEYCRKIANITDSIEQDFHQQQNSLHGTLRIASNTTFGSSHLLDAIQTFMEIHPQLNVQMQLGDKVVNLVEEAIDVAIRITNNPDPSLIARPLAKCHSLIVASPNYLARYGTPKRPEELSQHRYLAHANINKKEWKFSQADQEVHLELTSTFTTNDTLALLNFTLSDGGIAMLPKYLTSEHLAENRLTAILTDWQLPTYSIYALYASRHKLSPNVRQFVDFLVERFANQDW